MFGDRAHLLIDLIEQRRDQIDGGGHRLLRSSQGCTLSTSLEEMHDHDNKASKHYGSYWFVLRVRTFQMTTSRSRREQITTMGRVRILWLHQKR